MITDRNKVYTEHKEPQVGLKNILRKTAMSTLIVGGCLLINPVYPEKTNMPSIDELTYADRLERLRDASKLSDRLIGLSPYKHYIDTRYMNVPFLIKVSDESEWASKQLNIPKEFIMAQWLMESGRLQPSGFGYVSKNNLAGIKRGNDPMEFEDLHGFASSYVSILQKGGIRDTKNFWKIVKSLRKRNYFANESPLHYGTKVLSVLRLLSHVNDKYGSYYKESLDGLHGFAKDKKALYALRH